MIKVEHKNQNEKKKNTPKKKKSKKKIEFQRVEKDVEWIVAIDCSLNSPGIVIRQQTTGRDKMFGWAHNQKHYQEFARLNDERVHIFPPFAKFTDKEMDLRLEEVSEAMLRVIYGVVGHSLNVVVAFEGLPFALENTSSRVQLADILAITRHKCFLAGWRLLHVMPPTIKKKWTGYGNAKKPDMLNEYLKRFPVSADRPRFFQHPWNINPDKIIHPAEDMIDALALCHILLY